jgi:hypothetical protein
MTFGACSYATILVGCLTSLAAGAQPSVARADNAAIELRARGVQIYVCEQTSAAAAWRLVAPEAALLDSAGAEAGLHFAGPSWQATDGSTVVGEALVSSQSPVAGSVPWLVLRAKSYAGSGEFTSVEYIVRLQTEGGGTPTGDCDQAHVGAEKRVPYNAVYVLFRGPGQ